MKSCDSFVHVMSNMGVDTADEISNAFAHFDTNGDGSIDKVEMMRILQSIDEDFFSTHVVNILFREADVDNDGSIYYGEFANWILEEDPDITFAVLDRVAHCPTSQ